MEDKNMTPTISIDAIRVAGQDLFPLILDMEKLLHSYGLESVSFISEIFSTTSREEQFDILVNTLQRIKNTPAESADCADVVLPCPIVTKQRIKYNSPETWRIDSGEGEDD